MVSAPHGVLDRHEAWIKYPHEIGAALAQSLQRQRTLILVPHAATTKESSKRERGVDTPCSLKPASKTQPRSGTGCVTSFYGAALNEDRGTTSARWSEANAPPKYWHVSDPLSLESAGPPSQRKAPFPSPPCDSGQTSPVAWRHMPKRYTVSMWLSSCLSGN